MAFAQSARPIFFEDATGVPAVIKSFFKSVNDGDELALMGLFAADAVVNDQMQELCGIDAITTWIVQDVVGLEMKASGVLARPRVGGAIVSAEVTGNFNAPGLPEPLILMFYFVLNSNEIDQLIILRADL